jgi:hypothetical protein
MEPIVCRRMPLPVSVHVKINRRRRPHDIDSLSPPPKCFAFDDVVKHYQRALRQLIGKRSIAEAKPTLSTFCAVLLKDYDAKVSALSTMRSIGRTSARL